MRDDGEHVRAAWFPEVAVGVERNGPSQWYHRSALKLFVVIGIALGVLFVVAVALSVPEEAPDDGATTPHSTLEAGVGRRAT